MRVRNQRPLARSMPQYVWANFVRHSRSWRLPQIPATVEAQYLLSSFYRSGRGVRQDDALAFKWMKAAAERGHTRAQFNLAIMYLDSAWCGFRCGLRPGHGCERLRPKATSAHRSFLLISRRDRRRRRKTDKPLHSGIMRRRTKMAASCRFVFLRKQPSETDVRR